jgi:Cysteine rich repeat
VQWRIVGVTASVLIALAGPVLAQQPTQAQANAIRQACRGDYQTYCANVPTGGSAALSCLQQNASSLSPGCQTALGAVSHGSAAAAPSAPPPAATPAPGTTPARPLTRQQELSLMRRACQHDYRLYCNGVRPGAGRVVGCLRDNAQSLSPSCRSALLAARQAP